MRNLKSRSLLLGISVFAILVLGIAIYVWAPYSKPESISRINEKRDTHGKAPLSIIVIPTTIRALPASHVAGQMPPANVAVREILPELKKMADAGNAVAACRVAFELGRCGNVDALRKMAARASEQADNTTLPWQQEKYMATYEFWRKQMERAHELCAGVEKNDAAKAGHYLLQAARLGNVEAMARFAAGVTLNFENLIASLDELIAFRDEGPTYLQRAIDEGVPGAFETARFAYDRGDNWGVKMPIDHVKALSFKLALMKVAAPKETERLQSMVQNAITTYKLSESDIAEARRMADAHEVKLLGRVQPGTVDFTQGTYYHDDGRHCERSN